MKFLYVTVIIFLIITIAIAGCTSSTQSNTTISTVTEQAVSTVATTPIEPTEFELVAGSNVDSLTVFNNNYTNFEYTTTVQYPEQQVIIDTKCIKSDTMYQGQPVIRAVSTITDNAGLNLVDNILWDNTMTTALTGTATMTLPNGQVSTVNITPSELRQAESNNINRETTLTFEGIELVTVPAGSFPIAGKYLESGNTVWASPGIPIPVRMDGSSDQSNYTMVLDKWG